jgi:hypothetical protein
LAPERRSLATTPLGLRDLLAPLEDPDDEAAEYPPST